MFFKALYIAATVLSTDLVFGAGAVNMIGYPDTVSCTDVSFECDGFVASRCCGPFPPAFGFSAKFTGLPPGGQGSVFRDDGNFCVSFINAVFGPGDKCWNGGGFDRMNSMFWTTPGVFKRDVSTACSPPNRFSFVNGNGEKVRISVPKGQVDSVAELFKKKDFKTLNNFQKVNASG